MWIFSNDTSIQLTTDQEGTGPTDRFYPDAMTGYTRRLDWDGTPHPIASGFDKTQAIRPANDEIVVTGCVGSSASKNGVDLFAGTSMRTTEACRLIKEMGDAADCVEIELGDKFFDDMYLASAVIQNPRDDFSPFDLTFRRLSVFNPSVVFNAALGMEVDIGEVSATEGEPTNPPPDAEVENQDAREVFFNENRALFDQCDNDCAEDDVCIEACYTNLLERFTI